MREGRQIRGGTLEHKTETFAWSLIFENEKDSNNSNNARKNGKPRAHEKDSENNDNESKKLENEKGLSVDHIDKQYRYLPRRKRSRPMRQQSKGPINMKDGGVWKKLQV